MKKIDIKKIFSDFSNKVGIDLGTAITSVYTENGDFIFNEPTFVIVNVKTGQIFGLGKKARNMLGRTPPSIKVVQPLKGGVITDFQVTTQLLAHLLSKVQSGSPRILGPTVVVGIPCSIRSVEAAALVDAMQDAGARELYMVPEPIAAIVGMGLSTESDEAKIVVDIGGGTTDILVLGGGSTISSKSVRIGGDDFNQAIIDSLAKKYNITVGVRTAEDLKINSIGSKNPKKRFGVRGRDVNTGLPSSAEVTLTEIQSFVLPIEEKITKEVREMVEVLPEEISADIVKEGIYLVGGGSYIAKLAELIEKEVKVKTIVPEDSLNVIVRGAAKMAEDPELYNHHFL